MFLANLNANARPWPQAESDLPADPAIQWGRLDNGIRVVILPWDEPPERVSLRLLVESGSLQETERQKGLAHMLEHMAFNGTRHFSAGEMVEYFQRLGMAFGPDTNAHTWWRETVYKLELPRSDEALLRDGLMLLRDYADGMLLEPEEVEKEKGVILSEYRDRNSPQFQAYLDGLKFALPDTRISRRVTIGDEDVITMATPQDLRDYYEKWYRPERLVLIAVGDVDPGAFKALAAEYFADMQREGDNPADPDLGTIEPVEQRTRLFSNPELPMGELEIFTRRRIAPSADTLDDRAAQMRLDLANAILTRRFDRLSQQEGAALARGQGYDYRWLDFVRYSGVTLSFEPEKYAEAMKVAVEELNRAIAFGFTEAELEEARANLINAYRQAAERAPTRKSRDLSEALVRAIREDEVFLNPAVERDLMVPLAEAATAQSVSAAFAEAWNQKERMINITGNFDAVMGEVYAAAAALPVEPPAKVTVKEWAYGNFGQPGEVVADSRVEDLDIRQITFANGVRLNLKRTDYEAGKVTVKASIGNGQLDTPADLPGLALLAGSTFIDGGLIEHSRDEIQALTAGRTVGLGFAVDDDQFTLGGTTTMEDLPLQLELLAAYITAPGYRPEARRLFMRQVDALYSQLAHNPDAVLQNEVARFLASGDSRFGFPAREDLEQRSMNEVATWLTPALESGYLEVAVVGDFLNEEDVIAAVAATLGALPGQRPVSRPELAEARKVSFPRGAEPKVFKYQTDIPRGIVTVNWPTTDQSDIELSRRLSVLADVLDDRMRIKIREEIGEAYSPYAYNFSSSAYSDYGFLRAYVGVEPSTAAEIQGILIDIGDDLASGTITEDERLRAIEPVKARIEEYRRTNRYWVDSVALRSQDQPERLDWARSFLDFWDTVTVEELNELATRYLQPTDAVPVQVQP